MASWNQKKEKRQLTDAEKKQRRKVFGLDKEPKGYKSGQARTEADRKRKMQGAPVQDQWDANRNIRTDLGPNYNVSSRASGSEGYKPTKTDMGPTYDSKPSMDSSVSTSSTKSKKYPDYSETSPSKSSERKETATGSLSTKSESKSSDRMSWAREAEKKARKLMGGN